MTLRTLGIDPSIRSTGICYMTNTVVAVSSTIPTHDLRGMVRLKYIASELEKRLIVSNPDIIVMEGYAMGIKGGRAFDIGEMGYAIKQVLYKTGIPTYIIPPTTMKKFVTGKGTAKKDAIHDALLTKWDILIDQEDEADAAGLALFGYYLKHKRLQRSLTDDQRDALKVSELLK